MMDMDLRRKTASEKEILVGLLMISVSLAAAISLFSHKPGDTGLFVASGETQNILGLFGSCTADILTQSLGLFSYPFILGRATSHDRQNKHVS